MIRNETFLRGAHRTPEYQAAVRALAALPADLRVVAYAEASADEEKQAWEKARGVRRSRARLEFWGALIGKRPQKPGIVLKEECLPADDHTSLWTKNGEPEIYVSQPYGLSYENLKQIVAACEEHGLTAAIDTWPSWHYPGRVVTVEYRRRDASGAE